MLHVCPSGLKALIFVNTTPFPHRLTEVAYTTMV